MKKNMTILIWIAAFIILIGGATLAYNILQERTGSPDNLARFDQNKDDGTTVTDEILVAPDFNVLNSEGKMVLLSDFRGKPVVINFWASWCPPCQEEMPDFERVYRELGDDVHFLMIDLVDGQRETQAKGEAFIADNGFTFPVYFDTTREAAYTYEIRSIPTTFFVDSEGHLIAGSQGMIDEATLRKGIDMLWE